MPLRRTSIFSAQSDDEEEQRGERGIDTMAESETCFNLARTAMDYTSSSHSDSDRNYGRQLLSEVVSRRQIPGLGDRNAPCTMQDCLTAYYLSEANRNLGRENSQHYYLQEALTLVESLMLRKASSSYPEVKEGAAGGELKRNYESAKVNARLVLAEWTGQPMERSAEAA